MHCWDSNPVLQYLIKHIVYKIQLTMLQRFQEVRGRSYLLLNESELLKKTLKIPKTPLILDRHQLRCVRSNIRNQFSRGNVKFVILANTNFTLQ